MLDRKVSVWWVIEKGSGMDHLRSKPQSAGELMTILNSAQDNMGRGGRRVANFFIANLGETALLSGSEVASRCGVNASSVVRFVQTLGFSGYREFQSVLQQHLSASIVEARQSGAGGIALPEISKPLRLVLLADSGRSFNEAAEAAAKKFSAQNASTEIETESHASYDVQPEDFARRIESAAETSDGIILVAREHPAINDAVRAATGRGLPVICLTTDLPLSGRAAYVGSDQYVSGATAAWLCGRMLPRGTAGKVLFVCSVPFRCHQDREQGFRHVLRSEFSTLAIDERVSSNESIEVIYEAVRRYIAKSGPPAAIYNVSGANLGVGRALEAEGLSNSTVFVGHELNANSRSLLERGIMDVTIGHDFDREIALSVDCIRTARQGIQPVNRITQSQVFTRFNCATF
ncbi:substrate-binding domain-containing protein [Mesorhizobium sp. B2-3-14]|uniref:substrate-binding domain-containing protein n=1 Tax=unclassified Mesorhizobium TaxID=325217 RepID=UPI001128EFF2|nr:MULTISPECIES: substrate-binding domain-containing protein [unclassified Mesorhizobium]TPL74080.1 substrate-binding domain-containing protein [Mesorhizobium sp. B2-3-15]TPL79278.1 substrate-binding domain-containing protein [Mesorhizobium sp. B2-3-14]